MAAWKILIAFKAMALLGPIAGIVGFFVLADRPAYVAAIELLASGGILYLIFQDIAPQARLEQRWLPPLGAALGFALGMVGHMLI